MNYDGWNMQKRQLHVGHVNATRVNVDARCVHRLLIVSTCVSEGMRGCGHHSPGTACRLLDAHEPAVAHFFAPIANLVLGSVRRDQEGLASGVNNAIREFGGVLGVAVMGAIFAARGGYGPTTTLSAQQHFVNGVNPAVFTGAAVLLVAAATVWALPRGARAASA